MSEKQSAGAVLVGAGVGAALGVTVASLVAARPALAAPDTAKLDYLIGLQVAMLQQLQAMLEQLQRLVEIGERPPIAPPGREVPPVEIVVSAPWIAREPEEIFNRAIRAAGTFHTHKMVNFSKGKRLTMVVDSTLNQPVTIQPIGNFDDTIEESVDIGPPLPCAAMSKISIGFAWDDWILFIGARAIITVAPTAGILTISAVMQE